MDFSDKLLWLNGQKLTKINNKSFLFTTYGSSNKALEAAISYRDTILDSHLKELSDPLGSRWGPLGVLVNFSSKPN